MSRPARLDRLCAEAVELARAAAEETGEGVGEYLHAEPEADRVVTHFFESTLVGYQGWRWAVVVARAPRSRTVTVNETALLPGPDALNAPEWVPWAERLRAGDVGVGDLLPTDESDTRLMPAYTYSDDDAVEDVAFELGVGRTRVMSREGRIDTAERWYEGEHGPNAEISTSAPAEARCGGCGFYLPLAGSLRQLFGVCGNMYASDDAMVVSADHGCGAHSEVLTQIDTSGAGLVDHTDTAYDDALIEQIDTTAEDDEEDEDDSDASAAAETETATDDAPQAEDADGAAEVDADAATPVATATGPEDVRNEAELADSPADTADVPRAEPRNEAEDADGAAEVDAEAATPVATATGPEDANVAETRNETELADSPADTADVPRAEARNEAVAADAVDTAEVPQAESPWLRAEAVDVDDAADAPQADVDAVSPEADAADTTAAEAADVPDSVPADAAASVEDTDEPEAGTAVVEAADEPVEAPAEVTVTVPRDEPVEVAVVEEPEAPAVEVTVGEPAEAATDDTPKPAAGDPAEDDTPTATEDDGVQEP